MLFSFIAPAEALDLSKHEVIGSEESDQDGVISTVRKGMLDNKGIVLRLEMLHFISIVIFDVVGTLRLLTLQESASHCRQEVCRIQIRTC